MNVFEDSLESLITETSKLISPREFEVLLLIGRGELNKHIAVRLGISDKTATTHRTRLYKKLNIKGCAEIGVLAWRIRDLIPEIKAAIALRVEKSCRAAWEMRLKGRHILVDAGVNSVK